jgi:DNA-binding XRE family transcriptional regulator
MGRRTVQIYGLVSWCGNGQYRTIDQVYRQKIHFQETEKLNVNLWVSAYLEKTRQYTACVKERVDIINCCVSECIYFLVEQQRAGKWLAKTLGKNEATASRWCTNESQLSLETLVKIANALKIDIKDLFVSTKK